MRSRSRTKGMRALHDAKRVRKICFPLPHAAAHRQRHREKTHTQAEPHMHWLPVCKMRPTGGATAPGSPLCPRRSAAAPGRAGSRRTRSRCCQPRPLSAVCAPVPTPAQPQPEEHEPGVLLLGKGGSGDELPDVSEKGSGGSPQRSWIATASHACERRLAAVAACGPARGALGRNGRSAA